MADAPRVVVLGGGACGMTAALTLQRAGARVTVLERERRVDDVVRALGPARGARMVASYARERLRRLVRPAPDVSFEDRVVHRFGRALYDAFFGPYTEKSWGIPPDAISADWAAQRISLLSLSDVMLRLLHLRSGGARTYARRYLYPRLGMAAATAALGGTLVTGARVTGLGVARGYHLDYRSDRARLLAFAGAPENLVTCGRQGAFRYIFMDTAMEMGIAAARWVLDRTWRAWPRGARRAVAELRSERGLVEARALTA